MSEYFFMSVLTLNYNMLSATALKFLGALFALLNELVSFTDLINFIGVVFVFLFSSFSILAVVRSA